MLVAIIVIAVIAFLLVLFFFNYQSVINFLKNLFKKKQKKDKPKENKEAKKDDNEPAYEDFVPLTKDPTTEARDNSIEELFNFDDFDDDVSFDESMLFDSDSSQDILSTNDKNDKFDFDNIFNHIGKPMNKKKSLAKQIRDLPPEIKIMVVDNVLNKRDDV